MECLDEIIGLSETECSCFDDDKPISYDVSKSGVFLDQLEGLELNLLDSAGDCAKGGLWDLMEKARKNATKKFTADMLSSIQSVYKQRHSNFAGMVGETNWTSTRVITKNYAGVRIDPRELKGAYLYLNKIGLLVNKTQNVDVKVYSNENDGTLISSYTIPTIANTLSYGEITPEPLELKMYSYNKTPLYYYVLIDLTGGVGLLPLNNKKHCGCGGARPPYKDWLDIYGSEGADPNDIDKFTTSNNKYINGVVLDIKVKCKVSEVICNEENPLDFEDDGYALQMAYAIRFKAGELLLGDVYNSSNINRFTLLDREKIVGYMKYYRDEYNKWIDWLSQEADIDNNHCLICKEGIGPTVKGIRA